MYTPALLQLIKAGLGDEYSAHPNDAPLIIPPLRPANADFTTTSLIYAIRYADARMRSQNRIISPLLSMGMDACLQANLRLLDSYLDSTPDAASKSAMESVRAFERELHCDVYFDGPRTERVSEVLKLLLYMRRRQYSARYGEYLRISCMTTGMFGDVAAWCKNDDRLEKQCTALHEDLKRERVWEKSTWQSMFPVEHRPRGAAYQAVMDAAYLIPLRTKDALELISLHGVRQILPNDDKTIAELIVQGRFDDLKIMLVRDLRVVEIIIPPLLQEAIIIMKLTIEVMTKMLFDIAPEDVYEPEYWTVKRDIGRIYREAKGQEIGPQHELVQQELLTRFGGEVEVAWRVECGRRRSRFCPREVTVSKWVRTLRRLGNDPGHSPKTMIGQKNVGLWQIY